MEGPVTCGKRAGAFVVGLLLVLGARSGRAAPAAFSETRLLEFAGTVEWRPAGVAAWQAVTTNMLATNFVLRPGDWLRTQPASRALVQWSGQSAVSIGERSELEVLPPTRPGALNGWNPLRGLFQYFHRDQPGDVNLRGRTQSAAVRGTEFHLEVREADGAWILTMFDGEVELANEQGRVTLRSGDQGTAIPGSQPTRTALLAGGGRGAWPDPWREVIQWRLYYPAVLDVSELPLDDATREMLRESLAAYRAGDLLQALALYPAGRQPASEAETVYLSALRLAVGQVAEVENALRAIQTEPAAALRQLISAVKFQAVTNNVTPSSATAWMARSYALQAQSKLEPALQAARAAVERSPEFGFAWARVAELEFSRGRPEAASRALDRAFALAPRNAQALALKGFTRAAENRVGVAMDWFDRAIAVDGALANAWLGRGLCRIRRGRSEEGRSDLLAAAALEPQRALLRSYLGKALGDAGDIVRATNELALAKLLDPLDPTAWLYSALLERQGNRVNVAARDLQQSQVLNDSRSLYRSRLLLDQDRAVRSANLAQVYEEAGLGEVSVREAGRAVAADYANYSAHLFLANSYDQLRDPRGVNLRYETPALSEYLIANLLAPVAGGTFSPAISQQEYSRLFEQERIGVSSTTEYLSRGEWRQAGSVFGIYGWTSFSIDGGYHADPGTRPNEDIEERGFGVRLKQSLAPRDTIFLELQDYEAEGGNRIQYYDPSTATNQPFRFREDQEPVFTAGYHHEWSPGVHTLALFNRLHDRYSVTNPLQGTFALAEAGGSILAVDPVAIEQDYQSTLTIYSGEIQQIVERGPHTWIAGAQFQSGEFDTRNAPGQAYVENQGILPFLTDLPAQRTLESFDRQAVYGYWNWRVFEPLLLVAGLRYDRVNFPENFRAAPLTTGHDTADGWLPKGGVVWTPGSNTTLRAAYARSLAGASLDQSYRLEPSQVAGINQSYRSLVPESLGGASAGEWFDTAGFSLEQRVGRGTWLAVQGDWLESSVSRTLGTYSLGFPSQPVGLRNDLDFRERSLTLTANQLLGDGWSVGARYRWSDAEVTESFPGLPAGITTTLGAPFPTRQRFTSTLHHLNLHAGYVHPVGFFTQLEANWYHQDNHGPAPAPGDDFWQFHVLGGWRFLRRRAEVTVGILNLTGQDYRLSPLNYYQELPRERTFFARVGLWF